MRCPGIVICGRRIGSVTVPNRAHNKSPCGPKKIEPNAQDNALKHNTASAASAKTLREVTGQGNQVMKKTTLAALAMSLAAATSAHAEKPTDPQTELIVNLAVITASVDRCHFEIDSRIIGLDLSKELMLIEDAPPGARYHYNMASALTTGANAVQGAYDEDPREWCESTWRNYGPDGVTKRDGLRDRARHDKRQTASTRSAPSVNCRSPPARTAELSATPPSHPPGEWPRASPVATLVHRAPAALVRALE